MPVKSIFVDSESGYWEIEGDRVQLTDAPGSLSTPLAIIDIPEFIEWLQSEYAKHKPEAKADDDGWIKWEGGECPVDGWVMVDVMWSEGGKDLNNRADDWHWGDPSLKAYRLSK